MDPVHEQAEIRLNALWQAHARAVVRYAQRRVLPGEVDEVVAETFLVAWRRLDDVPARALPWLLGVARGVSANVRRAGQRRAALTDRLVATSNPQKVADADDGQLTGSLALALASLRPQDRELLTLLAWDGLSQDEAAMALNISRGAVAVRLHRLRRRLRAELVTPETQQGSEPTDVTTATAGHRMGNRA